MADAGWYPDPDDPAQQRYWDGMAWTEHRLPVEAARPPTAAADPFAPSASGAGSSLRSKAQAMTRAAKESTAAKSAGRGAQSASSVAKRVAVDAQTRDAAVRLASSSWSSVLDGAGVRNRQGRVKPWRVARAALRPRKTIARVGSGVAGMGLDDVKSLAGAAAGAANRPDPSDASIVLEWAIDDVHGAAARWRAAMDFVGQLEDGDEVSSEAALDAAYGIGGMLAFCIVGDPPITDEEAVESTGRLLAILLSIDEASTWAAADGPPLRVAAATMRRFGVQPTALGGNGDLDDLFESPIARLRLAAALSLDGWSSDPVRWFA
jgi:hypothetical protein